MGPRPFSRGNAFDSVGLLKGATELQWGRGLSAAEMIDLLYTDAERYLTSMGPRPFTRGNDGSCNFLKTHNLLTLARPMNPS